MNKSLIAVIYTPKNRRLIVDVGVHSFAVAFRIYDRSECDSFSITPRPTTNQMIGAPPDYSKACRIKRMYNRHGLYVMLESINEIYNIKNLDLS